MPIPDELLDVLDSNPSVMGGAVRFRGTRVPVLALLETLEDGDTVASFLAGYPSVHEDQVVEVILWQQREARKSLGLNLDIR